MSGQTNGARGGSLNISRRRGEIVAAQAVRPVMFAPNRFDPKRTLKIGDKKCRGLLSIRPECFPPQSLAPGFGEKYCNLSGFPSHSLESAGGAFLIVIFGQIFAYFAFSDNHSSSPGSVSGFMASTGHSGTQTLQSMHSSGWITSMFSPS